MIFTSRAFETRAELVELQNAGYNPASDEAQYPTNIQAAEARLIVSVSAYGASGSGTSDSGVHVLRIRTLSASGRFTRSRKR